MIGEVLYSHTDAAMAPRAESTIAKRRTPAFLLKKGILFMPPRFARLRVKDKTPVGKRCAAIQG
jgi:hypothetical protein